MHNITNLRQALRFLAIAKERLKTQEASEAALKVELRAINATLDDPRTDLTMTACEVIVALKKQVARLEDINRKLCDKTNTLTIQSARLEETITTLQAKSATLVDALEAYPDFGEYFMENLEATDMKKAALAAFKGDSNVKS